MYREIEGCDNPTYGLGLKVRAVVLKDGIIHYRVVHGERTEKLGESIRNVRNE